MDQLTDTSSMLDSTLGDSPDDLVIAEFDEWKVRPLTLNLEKIAFLWAEVNKYKALFNDFVKGDYVNFCTLLTSPTTLWFEVVDKDGKMIGVLFTTEMQRIIDCEAHVLFFDHRLQNKALLCRQVIEYIFDQYPLRRMTVTIPSICYAIIRWAGKVGFKEEGRKRQSILMGNRWVDEVILGILRQEVV